MARDAGKLRSPRLGPALVAEAPQLARLSRRLIESGLRPRWGARAIAAQIRAADTEVVAARPRRAGSWGSP